MAIGKSKSETVRANLKHPVIDSDGHIVEFEPAFRDYLKEVGGPSLVERYQSGEGNEAGYYSSWRTWHNASWQERHDRRITRPTWWPFPSENTLDRATATLPRLLYNRMGELGIDFAVLYPSRGLMLPHMADEELRKAACRAFNKFQADSFREYADRITPVAAIPMHTPQEAIDELEYAVKTLGLKAVVMAGHVRRPIPEVARKAPEFAHYTYWLDTFGLDSDYDYDPVWSKCVELGISPTFHSVGNGWGSRVAISNWLHNHIGHFAAAGEALCRGLFMGGVTRRFPTLKFAFLEGGVAWGCTLLSGFVGHWEKRNSEAMEKYNPAHLNKELLIDLCRRYGDAIIQNGLSEFESSLAMVIKDRPGNQAHRDEWKACQIEKVEDIRDLFVPHFYFGCEGDEPTNAWAFNSRVNPFGARLNAIFGSDIGHWDVPVMSEVLEEAYELVEKELITEDDFRDFVFANPVEFWTNMNPDFFKGTAVEQQAEVFLKEKSSISEQSAATVS